MRRKLTRAWAEPGSKMLSAGNYDNRPTRVWAELGSKLFNNWSVILQVRYKTYEKDLIGCSLYLT